MPFVSSFRGTFGPTSENRGVANSSTGAELDRQGPPFYTFNTTTFSPGAATGRIGPTLAQAIAGMTGTGVTSWNSNTAYFNTTGGVQLWTVPQTGTYTIDAFGARGSNNGASGGVAGGNGARIVGTFSLVRGQKLRIICGQRGLPSTSSGNSGGGGGGTFVLKETGNTTADILVIAGGGGGATSVNPGVGSATNSATGDNQPAVGNGGSAGSGGSGGGGWNGNGTNGAAGCTGGLSVANGSTGGAGATCAASSNQDVGGFGGGGGGEWCSQGAGGGGGGYTGGSGAFSYSNTTGGGGSYNNGTNQTNTAGGNTSNTNGFVIITRIS